MLRPTAYKIQRSSLGLVLRRTAGQRVRLLCPALFAIGPPGMAVTFHVAIVEELARFPVSLSHPLQAGRRWGKHSFGFDPRCTPRWVSKLAQSLAKWFSWPSNVSEES